MRILALLILLTACDVHPPTTQVDKNQDYVMPEVFTVSFMQVDDGTFAQHCPDAADVYGCHQWTSSEYGIAYIRKSFYDPQYIADHECGHPIYGPDHVGER